MDYAITHYPDGNATSDFMIMHEDIKEVIALGYQDEYREKILNAIDQEEEKR